MKIEDIKNNRGQFSKKKNLKRNTSTISEDKKHIMTKKEFLNLYSNDGQKNTISKP